MADGKMNNDSHCMTPELMAVFIESEMEKGASENTIRRLKATVKMVYAFLPEDKLLTRERLLEWCTDLNEKGYAYRGLYSIFKKHGFYFEMGGDANVLQVVTIVESQVSNRFQSAGKIDFF